MNELSQIHSALERIYREENHRIVFWNDPAKEFQNLIDFLSLDDVTVLRLDQLAALEVKIKLEREDPFGKYLLYSPAEEPDLEDDWLLDIRIYSRSFRADKATNLLQELGLANLSLRTHIADRRKFFDAKDRLLKLKSLVVPDDSDADLDRKMIAVVAKAEQPELFNIFQTILHSWMETGNDLDSPPPLWGQIEKFDLDVSFWKMVKSAFAFDDENPSLKMLLLRMMVTEVANNIKSKEPTEKRVPQAIRNLVLPQSGRSNVVACLGQWRDSISKGASYDKLSQEVAEKNDLPARLADIEIDDYTEVKTFLFIEKRIASGLHERVLTNLDTINAGDIKAIATQRQTGHWASEHIPDSEGVPRHAFHSVYDAIVAAAEFFSLKNQFSSGFSYDSPISLFRAYETTLYRFDQLYRHFCIAADKAKEKGWDISKSLRTSMETAYVNWYLTSLSEGWGKFIEPKDGLLTTWQLDEVPNQYRFYDRSVRPWLEGADNRRAFVIISDAFRYEAAKELTAELNFKYRFEAELSSQLGVLPSYTALGMASLLPHKTLAYKGIDVLVDGKSSVAGERDGILQSVGGLACKYDELMAKKKDEGREFVKDKRVVYIYHDTVDAIGDDGKTDSKTFDAVRTAINELAALVSHIINNLNGYFVVVTADHGFIFSETPRVETDKTKLTGKPNTIIDKKRYIIGPKLPDHESVWHGKMKATSDVDGDMEFWLPKGTNVFHFVGGARFVHGGCMPQEIVVPVITVKHVRGKSAQETKSKPVAVHVLGVGNNFRITATTHRFEIYQMDAVGERIKPITLKIAVYEGETPVTNVETMTFDSTSSSLEDRKKWVKLSLISREYNKKTPYRLVLQDAETGIEQQAVEVIIDRTFTDEF